MAPALARLFPRRDKALNPEKEGLVLLKTRGDIHVQAFTVVDDETIILASPRKSLFLCSVRKGDRPQAYENLTSYTNDVELLEDGNFADLGGKSIVARRISDGIELDRFERDETKFYCSASLGDGRFLVGTENGEVLEMQWSNSGKLLNNRTVNTSLLYINRISVCKDRFAVLSFEIKVVLVFEITSIERSIERVTAVEVDSDPSCVHLTDHFLVIGCHSGKIFVYSSLTFQRFRGIQRHSNIVNSVHVMGDGRHLLSAGWDGLVSLQVIETGVPIWEKRFSTGVWQTNLLSDGRLVTKFESGSVVVLDIPRDFKMAALMVPPPTPPTPIRDAFEGCISGVRRPSDLCEELITYDNCRDSFDEWCCAHQLLMMAVEDGDIPRNRDYNGEISWWLENLYVAAKDVPIFDDDDARTMKRFLVQAEKMGVVDGIEPVLITIRVTKDIKAEIRALQRADILLLGRVMTIEARLQKLKQSFERYRKFARNSQLIGVALQLIPIAGGSVAGVVSAGADIIEGLSVKDWTDYFLGLGSSVLLDETTSMRDRVLRGAARALSREQLDEMNMEHRRKLEEEVESWGFSVERLRELFLERVHPVEGLTVEAHDEPEPPLLEDEKSEDDAGATERQTGSSADLALDKASGVADTVSLERPSSWKEFEFDNEAILALSQKELSCLWAAYIVRNDDTRENEYKDIHRCLDSVLREEHLFGDVVIDSSALSSERLVETVMAGIERNEIRVTAGIEGRIRQFVSALRGKRLM